MSEERFNRIPHDKEPAVALELQSVVSDAKQGKETAYKISLRKTADSLWSLYLDHIRRVNYGGKLIILDAYGEKDIYERVSGREVEIAEIKCKCRDNVTAFHYSQSTSRRFMDNEKYRLRLYYENVVPVLKRNKNKKVLIYTQKRYAEWLAEMIKRSGFDLSAVAIKWYWMDRGDDSYGDFDTEILFGTSYSNVVGDMHLVNAMYAGEEVIDFSKLRNGEYADPRVAAVKKSRQENEMMQAIYRVRPSKPRSSPQEIHIISNMRLPLSYEMYGATIKTNHQPDFDKEGILIAIQRMFDYFGFYTPVMAAFTYEVDLLIDWYESGASSSEKRLLMEYDELKNRMEVFCRYFFYKRTIRSLLGDGLDLIPEKIHFGDKNPTIWGNKEKAIEFLEHMQAEFREPGSDDGDFVESDEAEAAGAEDQEAPDEQQVADETKHHRNEDALKLLELLRQSSTLSDEEFRERYASSYEELDFSGTDTT
jgi:hypothetical protein